MNETGGNSAPGPGPGSGPAKRELELHLAEMPRTLDKAGISRDDGLRPAFDMLGVMLRVVADGVDRLADAGQGKGAGLPPDVEHRIVERGARLFAQSAEGVIERRTSRLGWRSVLSASVALAVSAALAGAAGYWAGERAGAQRAQGASEAFRSVLESGGLESAELWLRLVRYNPRISEGHFRNRVDAGGWRGGDLPLWYERVGPPG